MNKLFLLLVLSTPALGHVQDASHLCTLVGAIAFPGIVRPPQLTAYYKGFKIPIVDGSFHVPDRHGSESEIDVLCTLGPIVTRVHEETNTISHLCLGDKAPYKYFKVRKNMRYYGWHPVYAHMGRHNDEQPWFIETAQLPKGRCVIPECALLILIDPGMVDRLENEPWQTQGNTCRMPRIVLKKNLSSKAIQRMAQHSLLACLDLDPFHRPLGKITQAAGQRPGFTELVMPTEHHD